jgi:uncharacterized protein YkwD
MGTRSSSATKFASAFLVVAATMSTAPAAQAIPAATAAPTAASVRMVAGDASRDSFEAEVLRLTNQARSKARTCGSTRMGAVKPLRWNSRLARSANAHSADMATKNYFSHYSQSGVSPFTRIKATGYRYRAAGENIAAGRSLDSPAAVVAAWLKSPGHCRVIMNPKYRDLGVARVEGPGRWGVYWTQNFGRAR